MADSETKQMDKIIKVQNEADLKIKELKEFVLKTEESYNI